MQRKHFFYFKSFQNAFLTHEFCTRWQFPWCTFFIWLKDKNDIMRRFYLGFYEFFCHPQCNRHVYIMPAGMHIPIV